MNPFIYMHHNRDLFWDTLKLFLIFLVIYGHIIERYAQIGTFNCAMWKWIYLFHIPLFVFVSGRFSHTSDNIRFWNKIVHLFETYLFFQLLFSIDLLIDGNLGGAFLTTPYLHLWYLLSLIMWRLLLFYTPKYILVNRLRIVIISFFISLLAGYIPIGMQFSLQRTLTFLPFFVLGYYSVEFDFLKYLNRIPYMLAMGILFAPFLIMYLGVIHIPGPVLWGAVPYWSGDRIQFQYTIIDLTWRLFFLLSAIILSIMFIRIVPKSSNIGRWGRTTLFVFVYHMFLINILNDLINRNCILSTNTLLFLYAVAIILVLLFLSRSKIINMSLNPISSIISVFH